jgi:undecaprenyl-diphosphatase
MTDDHHDTSPSIDWRTSPIDRSGLLMMLTTFLTAAAVLTITGLAIVEWWDGSTIGENDADLIRWFEDERTESLTPTAETVSLASDTLTKVILGVALIPVCLWLFRRWHEYALIVGGLVVEVSAFGLSSQIVGRDRPPVEQLDGAPTNSFPSGHIAAATVFYGGLALVIFMRTRRRGPRVIAVLIAIVMPIGMVLSRLYLGMHYLSDAVAGLALGVVVLAVMWRVVHRTLPREESPAFHDRAELGVSESATP